MRSSPANFPTDLTMPFALYQGQVVSRARLWRDVAALAAQLPERPYAFNLCENRYLFCVTLLAIVVRKQVCLLPPGSQAAVIAEIADDYPEAYAISENAGPLAGLTILRPSLNANLGAEMTTEFDWQRPAVIAFTSGSTGRPKACSHNLATFKTSAEMAVASLGLSERQYLMVSTAPPQHMYGLESSVFWPLFSDLRLCDGRPFYAEDIRGLLQNAPWPSLLASTPTHLRALATADGDWRGLCGIVSATDHLAPELAEALFGGMGQSVKEIYGSTETLSFACRETRFEASWNLYAGCSLFSRADGVVLESAHLPDPALLQDAIEILPDGRFRVLGRQGDMLKIAGKRTSLNELNRRLRNIPGVEDGFFYLLPSGRLAALICSALNKRQIRDALQPYLDEVFLPRKIDFVSEIPRNATGKLIKAEVERLLQGLL